MWYQQYFLIKILKQTTAYDCPVSKAFQIVHLSQRQI